MTQPRRIYWDSCTWVGLINTEPDKVVPCRYIIEQAEQGHVEILVSTFSLVEVYKTRCDDPFKHLPEEKDTTLEKYFRSDFIIKAEVNEDVAICARRLLRYYGDVLKKPQDSVHLATALIYNADELHTYDEANLIPLSEKIERMDGKKLIICKPPQPPSDYTYNMSLLSKA